MKDGEESISAFNNTFSEKKIKDGEGVENIPFVVGQLNSTIVDIQNEFKDFALVANMTNNASEYGR